MKTRLLLLASLMGLQLTAHAQKYQMDVEVKGGLITSYVVNDLQDVVCKDTTTTITLSNKETVVYVNKDIASLSWTEYKGSQSGSNGSYNLDMNHSAIVTPDYSVKFLAGSITGETNLTVKKVNNAPSIISTGVDEMVVYDFTLDKPKNFDGVAEIRLPMKSSEGDMVFGAYFNPEINDWDGVPNYYDEDAGEVVISTNHFSEFGIFRIAKQRATAAKLELLSENNLQHFIAQPRGIGLGTVAKRLREFVFEDNPDTYARDAFCNKYSEVSQIGLDIGYNGLKGLGLENSILEGFSTVLGHVGTAVSVYQICRNDFHKEDAMVAGNTMKFTINQCVSKMASAVGTSAMYACLASVAIMDYSINKFATEAHSGRKDMYVKTYNLWMDNHPRHNGDWATLFKPYFRVFSNYTREEIHQLIDKDVTTYCNEPWHDDFCAQYFHEATGAIWTYTGGLNDALCQELVNNKKRELYDGDVSLAVERLKGELLQEMYPKMRTKLDDYAYELNRGFSLILVDSSLIESKAKESAFAGYTVRFKDHPNQEFEGLQWEVVLDKEGHGEIGNRIGFLAFFEQKGILELVSPKGKVINTIYLKSIKAGYTTNGSRKNVDNYVNIAPPQVSGVLLAGSVSCSSPSYRKGEKKQMSALAVAASSIPGSIIADYDENRITVKCLEIIEDEDENIYLGSNVGISFDIENPMNLETSSEATIKNLFFNAKFSFSSGDDLMYEEFCRMKVTSELPMKPGTLYPKPDGGGDDDDDDDSSFWFLAFGGKYAKTWGLSQAGGLKFASDYSITRKDYIYEWDKEARKDVLDHIDTHTFTLINDPENTVQLVVFFK